MYDYNFPLAEGELKQPWSALRSAPQERRKREAEFREKGDSEDHGPNHGGQDQEQDVHGAGRNATPDADSAGSNAIHADGLAQDEDYWSLTDCLLIRHHAVPRQQLFIWGEGKDKPPIPIEYIDISRRTFTDSTSLAEVRIDDVWHNLHEDGDKAQRTLTTTWVGKTEFDLLKPPAKPGYKWCNGRERRGSTRPHVQITFGLNSGTGCPRNKGRIRFWKGCRFVTGRRQLDSIGNLMKYPKLIEKGTKRFCLMSGKDCSRLQYLQCL